MQQPPISRGSGVNKRVIFDLLTWCFLKCLYFFPHHERPLSCSFSPFRQGTRGLEEIGRRSPQGFALRDDNVVRIEAISTGSYMGMYYLVTGFIIKICVSFYQFQRYVDLIVKELRALDRI